MFEGGSPEMGSGLYGSNQKMYNFNGGKVKVHEANFKEGLKAIFSQMVRGIMQGPPTW